MGRCFIHFWTLTNTRRSEPILTKSKQFSGFKAEALKLYPGKRYVRYLDPDKDLDQINRLGFSAAKAPVAYICAGKTCGPPVNDPSNIGSSLSSLLAK